MTREKKAAPVVVIGGGLAGICASISLARMGVDNILVHDRTVLGGNSSSEIGVPIGGADRIGTRRHARETGILDELLLDNAWFPNWSDPTTSQGFSGSVWDIVLRDAILRESRITLITGATAMEPVMKDGRIRSIIASQTGSERAWEIEADWFIDCSGDGRVAYESGAHWVHGAEASATYGEDMAPAQASSQTMGSSVYIRARDVGRPVPFEPPQWAHLFDTDEDFPGGWADCPHEVKQLLGYPGGYWWFEFGGEMDTIRDQETIHFELLRYVMGVWDHIKNKGDHGATNLALDWISPLPGKRESRRFLGDHILCQGDLETLRAFNDTVAYGGWNIDIHYPHGISGRGLRYWYGKELAGKYAIPLGSLYSRNIQNLLLAGRNASVSHVALGSSRIMATCAMMGQAAGNAAALCVKYRKIPKDIRSHHIEELQTNLLWQDVYLPGISGILVDNLARESIATASSEAALALPDAQAYRLVDRVRCQAFIAQQVKSVTLPLENTGEAEVTIRLELRRSSQLDLFTDARLVDTCSAILLPGCHSVHFVFNAESTEDRCWQLWMAPHPQLHWGFSDQEPPSTCAGSLEEEGLVLGGRGTHCFALAPKSMCYGPEQAITGVNRPEKTSNLWMANPGFPQWLRLDWACPVAFDTVALVFDNNLDRPLRRISTYRVAPELVRDYDLEVMEDGLWKTVASIKNNRQRLRLHAIQPVSATALRVLVHASNGSPNARIVEVRVKLKGNMKEGSI